MSKVRFLLLSMVMIAVSCCTSVKETPKEPKGNDVKVEQSATDVVPSQEEEVVEVKESLPNEMVISLESMKLSNDYRMVYVPGGVYTMGNEEIGTKKVAVKGFYMGETEVTQSLWKELMGNNPSHFKGDNLPVESVSWDDCQEFIQKLNAKTGKKFRLPTEAEWEFAARGGKQSHGYEYAGSNTLDDVAWYFNNCGSLTQSKEPRTHSVKSKQANELGLYDMTGNVWEWCSDPYQYKEKSANIDAGSASKVVKGGSWFNSEFSCKVSFHYNFDPDSHSSTHGVRLVMER